LEYWEIFSIPDLLPLSGAGSMPALTVPPIICPTAAATLRSEREIGVELFMCGRNGDHRSGLL
jgi:hypothetical protein